MLCGYVTDMGGMSNETLLLARLLRLHNRHLLHNLHSLLIPAVFAEQIDPAIRFPAKHDHRATITLCFIRPQQHIELKADDTDRAHQQIAQCVESKFQLKAKQMAQRSPEANFFGCQSEVLLKEARVCRKAEKFDIPVRQSRLCSGLTDQPPFAAGADQRFISVTPADLQDRISTGHPHSPTLDDSNP